MSVYIRKDYKDPTVYWYDFQFGGERFYGSTGKTRKREAELEEQRLRDEARKARDKRQAIVNAGPDLTIEQACAKYWQEKEKDHVPASRKDALRHLAWVTDHFQRTTRLSAIGDPEVARMVAARRGEYIPHRKEQKLVSNTTVNLTATFVLQRVMNRAYKVWKIPLQVIDWKEHTLPMPKERVREATGEEEAALLDRLDRGYEVPVRFSHIMGTRRMENLGMLWTDVDWINRRVKLRGKGGTLEWVPLPPEAYEILMAERYKHPTHVFTYVAGCTRRLKNGETLVAGQRYRMTKYSFRKAFDKARAEAGLVDYKFHDTRHTAATRLLRKSKNLRLVQRLLRHSDIETTVKYAHATMDDLADAMDAIYPATEAAPDKAMGK